MGSSLDDVLQQDSPAQQEGLTLATEHGIARVYEVDPLRDLRWQNLLQQHPDASVFHSVGWLDALRRTYGYEPVVFTTTPPTFVLENGLLFCRIRSWLTGNRIVSLPFSDHCAPLCDLEEELDSLICYSRTIRVHQKWKYLEVRPTNESFGNAAKKIGFRSVAKYILHRIDLEPAANEIFQRLNKDSVQRRVRHAERLGVVEVCGKSQELLKDFYHLLIRTRARHTLPPQPFAWFRNLLNCMGDAADLRLAYFKNVPVAAVFVLHFKDTSYYKYGCSDERFHNLGGIPFLLWGAILKAKSLGSRSFDLGRTRADHHSLIRFKNHWSPVSGSLTYWTFPPSPSLSLTADWRQRMVQHACACMPDRLLKLAGTLLYRHIG